MKLSRLPVACLLPALLAGCSGPAAGTAPITVAVPTPAAAGDGATAGCSTLAGQLPGTLGGASRRPAVPSSSATAAWGDPAVKLQCGVAQLAPPIVGSNEIVNGVCWHYEQHGTEVRWTTIDRAVAVRVTVPLHYDDQNGILARLEPAVAALPSRHDATVDANCTATPASGGTASD